MLNTGDRIRILEDRYCYAMVLAGDVLKVTRVDRDDRTFFTEAPRLAIIDADWMFELEDEGTGWERVE